MPTSHSYILIGGGNHASVVADAILSAGHRILGIFDDKSVEPLPGLKSCGAYRHDTLPESHAIISIGDNKIRRALVPQISHSFGIVIASTAVLSDYTEIRKGAMILQAAVLQPRAVVGEHSIINTRASVDHDVRIGDFVHIGPGAVLCGNITVGEGALVGAGATLLPGITIGAWATIGAGSVVIRDVPPGAVVAGNPARLIGEKEFPL